jgi:hypothetical protein
MANPEYVQAGEEVVVDLIDTPTWYIHWGVGVTGPVKGNTAMEDLTGVTEARVAGTNTQPSADINQWVGTITALAALSITESGLFDAVSAGNLIIRGTFGAIAVAIDDKIEFTYTLEQT